MYNNEVKKFNHIMKQNFFPQKIINEANSSIISQNNISKAELFNFDTNHKIDNIKNLQNQNQYHKYSGYLNGFIVILSFFIKFIITIFYVINKNKIIYFLFQIIFFIITIIISLICIFSSPGILPMNINNKQKKNYKNTNIIYKFKKKYYVLQGRLFKLKVCSTCLITRPLGSTHCKKCNACIEKIDHHCPWVGNCIGINNYRYFYYYLCSFNIFTIIDIISDIQFLNSKSNNCKNQKTIKIICIIFLSLNCLIFLFLISLLISHTIYVWYGETTYMRIKMKNLLSLFGNPFNKGPKENFRKLFCEKYIVKKVKTYIYLKPNTQFSNIYINKFGKPFDILSSASNIIINSNNKIQKLENQGTKRNTIQNVNINYYINNTINSKNLNNNNKQKNIFEFYKNYEEDKLQLRGYYHTTELKYKKKDNINCLSSKPIKSHYTFKLPPRKYLSSVNSSNSNPSSNNQSGNVFFLDHAKNNINKT